MFRSVRSTTSIDCGQSNCKTIEPAPMIQSSAKKSSKLVLELRTPPIDGPFAAWQRTVAARYSDRSFVAKNRSGVEIEPVYTGLDRTGKDAEMPGQFPYTRGIYPIHYQFQPWMDLQIIGFGLPAQTPPPIKAATKKADKVAAFLEATGLAGFGIDESCRIFGDPRPFPAEMARLSLVPLSAEAAKTAFLARFATLFR